jgi:homogentisate 1,2-dioxygenase
VRAFTDTECEPTPNQLRWSPFDIPKDNQKITFHEGIHTICGAGSPESRNGIAIHIYVANTDMAASAMYNSDGDYLIGTHLYGHNYFIVSIVLIGIFEISRAVTH